MSDDPNTIRNWPRYLLQWISLGAIVLFTTGLSGLLFDKEVQVDPGVFCPMDGIEALSTYLVKGSVPFSIPVVQVMMGVAILLSSLLFSKLFCGYLCPLGTVQDLLGKLRRAIGMKPVLIRSGSVPDKLLRVNKYVILYWVLFTTISTGELFFRRFDPYYAVAGGFNGEIILILGVLSVLVTVVGGFFIDNFWCRYLCPVGAVSNSFKFWFWLLVAAAIWYVFGLLGLDMSWKGLFLILCILGYSLEIIVSRPKFQLLHVVKKDGSCSHCGMCTKACPYHINVSAFEGKIDHVDCSLCGECVAACRKNILNTGFRKATRSGIWNLLPALLTILFVLLAFWCGNNVRIPTFSETWGLEGYDEDSNLVQIVDPASLMTTEFTGLTSVDCYDSSMAYKARLEQVEGVYGVRTYVSGRRAVVTYDPAATDPGTIFEEMFIPSVINLQSPDFSESDTVMVVTIRTEDMYDLTDVRNLGLQFKFSGKKIYSVVSEYSRPLTVKVYCSPSEQLDEEWFRQMVDRKEIIVPAKNEVRRIPVDFRFIRMEGRDFVVGEKEYKKLFQTE